ncbi:MAG TPA: NTP transferase domain-containing protein [Clostridiaceae bacterium]|nr:NTP transferase domain-containing protein [Clostridiaceae bacterium]
MENCAIVLAGSEDDRMCTGDTKVILEVAGKPVIRWVKRALDLAGIKDQMYIVGYRQEKVREELGETVAFALQEVPRGTGHAVTQAEPFLYERKGATVVVAGDTPLVRPETITNLLEKFSSGNWSALVLTAQVENPEGFGRVVRGEDGQLIAIIEDKETDEKTKDITEVNSGIYCFDTEILYEAARKIEARDEGNMPLTDIIEIMVAMGVPVSTMDIDPLEFFKVNERKDLSFAARALNQRVLERLMACGVSIVDPATTWIDDDVIIGCDTIIMPGTILRSSCVIGKGCTIGPYSTLNFTYVGDGSVVVQTESRQVTIDNNCTIGPWVRLFDGVEIGENSIIESHVEIKASRLGSNCHIYNQTSINKADLGHGVTVDSQVAFAHDLGPGQKKIYVGNHSFIGSQSCLVAPVRLANNSYVAAGTTVTRDVPKNALAIGRKDFEIKENWALHRR